VFGIAHHKAVDALRKRRGVVVPLDDLIGVSSDAEGPEAAALRADDRRELGEALATLSPEHRAVLELTYVEGFSQKEIAEIVACPVPTVKTRAFYAKQRLRDALATAERP
jgi:RNA polymerase sigma-70 factor (ECF subfamily)